jgi:hypothetical protein
MFACGRFERAKWLVPEIGRPPRSGRGGRRFKSCHSDHTSPSLTAVFHIGLNSRRSPCTVSCTDFRRAFGRPGSPVVPGVGGRTVEFADDDAVRAFVKSRSERRRKERRARSGSTRRLEDRLGLVLRDWRRGAANGVNVRPRKPPTCWPIIFIVRYYDVDQRFVACQLSRIARRPALFDFPSVPAGPSL